MAVFSFLHGTILSNNTIVDGSKWETHFSHSFLFLSFPFADVDTVCRTKEMAVIIIRT